MKRHLRLNSSAVRHSACMRKVQFVLDGYHEIATPNDIVFGNCFHDFVAAYRKNPDDFEGAVKKGWAFRETVARLYTKYRKEFLDDFAYFRTVCFSWSMEHTPWETIIIDGNPCAELGWSLPFYSGEHVDVSLCGTVDDICVHKDNPGVIAIRDYKTTSASDVGDYFSKYRMSGQLLMYYYGLTRSCEDAIKRKPDSKLANMWLGAQSRFVFIEGVFLNKEAFKCKFTTSDAFEVTPERVTEFEGLLMSICKRLDVPAGHQHIREGLVTRACESEGYGRQCSFFEVCAARTHEDAQLMLQSMFAKDEDYNPLLP